MTFILALFMALAAPQDAYLSTGNGTVPPQFRGWLWTQLQSSIDGKTYDTYELMGSILLHTPAPQPDPYRFPAIVLVCTDKKLKAANLVIPERLLKGSGDLTIFMDGKKSVVKYKVEPIHSTNYVGGVLMQPANDYSLVDISKLVKSMAKAKQAVMGYTYPAGSEVIAKFDAVTMPESVRVSCGL